MSPLILSGIISGVEQLISVVAEAYHNGEVSDVALEAGTSKANAATRKMIADEIAKRRGAPPAFLTAS